MSQGQKFIIIAEDDQFYQKVYQSKFKEESIDVRLVGNGEEVLAAMSERLPDLVLLDLIMPVMDGFTTLTKIREIDAYKGVKVIVLSNLGQAEDMEKAKQLGAQGYFVKANIALSDLISTIKSEITTE